MARYLEQVKTLGISSVNTADAFIKEMLVYGIAQQSQTADRRNRPFVPAPLTVMATRRWVFIHLASLDRLDGGHRLDQFEADEAVMARLHPEITTRAMISPELRSPPQTWSLFTWLNNGGIVMDWLMVGVEPVDPSVERVPTQLRSVPELAENFRLSRTHLTRKLREAEAIGSIGWEGNRGRSVMWISQEFLREYHTTQAYKLSIIDAACLAAGKQPGPRQEPPLTPVVEREHPAPARDNVDDQLRMGPDGILAAADIERHAADLAELHIRLADP
eukprot:gene34256-38719_t